MATRSDNDKAKKPARAQSGKNARAQQPNAPTNLSRNLKGIRFPADRSKLVQQAKSNGASNDVIRRIQEMPDRSYSNMAEVMKGSAGKK